MKKVIFIVLMLLLGFSNSYSQTDTTAQDSSKMEKAMDSFGTFLRGQNKEQLKYYKDKYTASFTKPYEEVFNAIKQLIQGENCMLVAEKSTQNDKGIYKGVVESDYCVFVTGEYSRDSLEYYSYRFPLIRGGDWVSGRMKYKFIIKEKEDASVDVTLKGELSGREDNVTHLVHFWESNGILEHRIMEKLNAKLGVKN